MSIAGSPRRPASGAVTGQPSPAELAALVMALDRAASDGAALDEAQAAPAPNRRRIGRWNDPVAGMRAGSWPHDLSPRRYGRTTLGGK